MNRWPLGPGRARYRVSRPDTPIDCCWALVQAMAGAGAIALLLQALGLVR